MASRFHIKEHRIPTQHIREWPRATASSQEDILYLSVKQYIPKDNPSPQRGDITIISAPANGFPKELYEALWCDLVSASARCGFRIRGIWIADVSNQGYSGVLNEYIQGNDPSWNDHARDLLHMTNVFRSDMPRPIVGIGHSYGANIITHLSLLHPRLFTTLVLLDPTITKFRLKPMGPGISPARGSAFRRDLWPSRQAAAESFRRSPFYRSWDPRVLEAWIEHGLRPAPTALFPDAEKGSVTLRTTKHQELFTYFRPLWPHVKRVSDSDKLDGRSPREHGSGSPTAEFEIDRRKAPDWDPNMQDDPFDAETPFPFYRSEGANILKRLPEVRPSVLWVFGGESDLSGPEARKLKTETCGIGPGGSGGIKEGMVGSVVMEGRGHLFPMEVPGKCAEEAAGWITKELKRWREEEKEFEQWRGREAREKMIMSREFEEKVGPPPTRKAKL